MVEESAKVFVIEDDEAVLSTVVSLLQTVKLEAVVFKDALTFFQSFNHAGPGCIITDVRLPAMSGIALVREAVKRKMNLPIIVMTGYADVDTAVAAFREGAFDFIKKPFSGNDLITMVLNAIEVSREKVAAVVDRAEIERRMATLTHLELDMMPLLMEGRSNKEAARLLDISYRTTERYRQDILKKLRVRNLVELVNIMRAADLFPSVTRN